MSDEGQEEPDQFSQEEGEDAGRVNRKLRQTIYFSKRVPKCFDSKLQHRAWKEQAAVCNPLPSFNVCTDCTPEYKLEMMMQKRCENPHIDFVERTSTVKTRDGTMTFTFLEGYPNMERYKLYRKRGIINASDD